ncbi:hypothetical protein Tco_0011819 [Tanacetum coccineum]
MTINSTTLVFSARSYPTKDPKCSTRIHSSINVITICPKQSDISQNNNPGGEEQEEKDNSENINTIPSSPPDPSVSFEDDGDVMFIEIIKKYDDSLEEELEEDENMMTGEMGVEYFDIFLTRSELAYHKNEEDKRRRVDYVMSKILGFYKECLELGLEYLTGLEEEGGVTLYLTRKSLEVLRKFHWMTLGGRSNQLSHVSSPLLSK